MPKQVFWTCTRQIETNSVRVKKNRLFLRYSQENRKPVTPVHPLMHSPVVEVVLGSWAQVFCAQKEPFSTATYRLQ